jgi:CheY-like chemotaxis protein
VAGPTTPATRRGKILVIDDEAVIAKAVQRTLSREHDVTVATKAADALNRFRAGETFDVILCDLMMPEMTGMDFYAELLKLAEPQARRIVFLSGGAFTPATRSFLERVPNLRIEKPFDMQNFKATVNDRIR